MSTDQPSTQSVAPPPPSKLQLENQSLKRRLVQYAATLEKLTTHAKREIDQSTRARDEALSRAADASALRQRISAMQTSLTSAQSARDTAAAARSRAEARVEQLQATLASLQRRLDDARYDDSHVASMKDELASLQKELPSLRRMREQEAARATALSDQLEAEKNKSASYDSLMLKLQNMQTHNSQLLTDRDAAQLTVSNMRRSESSLTREREDLCAKLRDSDDMNDMLRQQLHQTQDRLRLLEQRVKDAQAAEIQFQNDAADAKKQNDDAIDALRQELDNALKHLGERNTMYEELQQKHARSVEAETAISERDAMRANVRQLQVELDQSTEMLTRAAIDALADKAKIRKLEDALGKMRSDVDGERKQRGSSEVKIAALNQQIASLEADLDQLRASKRSLADECHKFQLQIHERDSIVASKNRALDELDTDRNDRAFQVDRLKLELSNTKNGLVKKETDLVRITTEYEEMCAMIRSTNKELESKHAEVNSIRKDLAAATDNINKLVLERDQLKVTASELQSTRRQAEELSRLVAAKDEELSSMKRWCTGIKAEAGESVREKKRLTDMLADVSGDLKRANQELELLRNMRQEQETLAQRISQISETSSRELSIMRQSQSEQAEVLAKSTVEQYQGRLAEMQKSARHEIAETVSSQLRDDIMPHLMRAVDAKARHLVHSLAKHVESFTLDDAAASYPSAAKDYSIPKPPLDSRAAQAETPSASLPPSAPQSTSRSLFVHSATESTSMSLANASHGGDTYEYTATEATTAEPSAVTSERSTEPLRELADSSIATATTGPIGIQPTDEELAGDIDPVAIHNRLTESYKELLGDHSLTDPTQKEGFRDINTEASMDNVSELVQVKTTTRQIISAVEVPAEQEPVAQETVPLETPVSVESPEDAATPAEVYMAEAPKEEETIPLETPASPVMETPELPGEKSGEPAEEVVGIEDAVPLETDVSAQSREIPMAIADAPQDDEPEEEDATPLEAPMTVEGAETPVDVEETPEDEEPEDEERAPLETAAAVESREILETITAPQEEASIVEVATLAEASTVVESREIPSVTMEDLHTAPVDSTEAIREGEPRDQGGEELEIVHPYVPNEGDLDESFEEAEDEHEHDYGKEVAGDEEFQDALDSEALLRGEVVSPEQEEEVIEDTTPLGDDSKEEDGENEEALDDASPLGHDTIEESMVEEEDQYEAAPRDLAVTPEVLEDASPLGDDVAVEDEREEEIADDAAPLEVEIAAETQEEEEVVDDALLQGDETGAADHREVATFDDVSASRSVDEEEEVVEQAVAAESGFALDDDGEVETLDVVAPSQDAAVAADQEEDNVAVDAAPLDDDVVGEHDGEELLHGEEEGHDHDDEEDSAADAAPLGGAVAAKDQHGEEAFASLDVDPVEEDDGEVEPTMESPPLADDMAPADNREDYTAEPLGYEAGQSDNAEDTRETPLTIPIVSADLGEAAGVAIAAPVPTDTAREDSEETHDREFHASAPKDACGEDDQGGLATEPSSGQVLLGSIEDDEKGIVYEQQEDEEPQQTTGDVLKEDTKRNLLSDSEVAVETEVTASNIAADEADEVMEEEGAPAVGIIGVTEDTTAQDPVDNAGDDAYPITEDEPREHNLDLGAIEPLSEEAVVIATQVDDGGSTENPVESELREVGEQIAIPETGGVRVQEIADEDVTETTRGFFSASISKDGSEDVATTSGDKPELLDLTAKYGESTSETLEGTTEGLQENADDDTDNPLDRAAHTPALAAELEKAEGEDDEGSGTGQQRVVEPEATAFDVEGEAKGQDAGMLTEDVDTSQEQEQESIPSPVVDVDAAVVEGGGAEEGADEEYIEEVDATREEYGGDEDFEAEPPVLAFATLNVVEEDDEDDDEYDEADEEDEGLSGQAPVEVDVRDEVEELDLTAEGRPADLDAHSDIEEDYEDVVDPGEVYGQAIVEELGDIQQVDSEQSPIVVAEGMLTENVRVDSATTEAITRESNCVTGIDESDVNQPGPEVLLGTVEVESEETAPPIAVDEMAAGEQVFPKPSIPHLNERVEKITTAVAETADDTVEGENILRA
ncbi:hypothetical protein BWQ96_04967 [Gracilariopsis chorda]|uniref:Nucleoprotein TPR n=1 Tax=Gracilariopsis chorda TaxID=448386 RepID=A0A2V3IT15_9FLOR|nr:hypothetical protein BWQ96_04967 [Gracilariopsis chorda]|eukprot:PXF45268.1 hypothetical protein BWQ96_04967 [Gracilariopsis chorda]